MGQKCEGNCDLWALNEIIEKKNIRNKKNRGSSMGANPANFEWKWAGLAKLFGK